MGNLLDATLMFKGKALEKALNEAREKGKLTILDLDSQQFKIFVYSQILIIHRCLAILSTIMPRDIQMELEKVFDMDIGEEFKGI